jgi:hypothetical protein
MMIYHRNATFLHFFMKVHAGDKAMGKSYNVTLQPTFCVHETVTRASSTIFIIGVSYEFSLEDCCLLGCVAM